MPTSSVLFTEDRGRVRFSQAPWYPNVKDQDFTVVGAGGIGSWLAHFAARAGAHIYLYDMDEYDVNNMGGQLAHHEDIGVNKAAAIARLVSHLLGPNGSGHITPISGRFTGSSKHITPVVFACVDDMNARKIIYERWKSSDDRQLLIDGRMGAEQFELYTATKDNDEYMKHWFPPEEATPLPCAYKATSHVGSLVASIMFGVMTNYFADQFVPAQMSFNMQMLMMEAQ